MKIFAGYDSGGTKTRCALADENGTLLSQAIDGASNVLFCSRDAAAQAIQRCTRKALENAGLCGNQPICSAYVGTASLDTFSQNQKVYDFLKECTGAEHLGMNSDAYIAWFATTFGEPGIISISGTGAVTVGIRSDGRWKRAGGWGCLVGDEGSGFSIGRRAIQLAVKSYDGRCEKNRFEQGILDFYSLKSMKELLPLIYAQPGGSNRVVASAAKYVFGLLEESDPLAVGIVEEAASEIADAVCCVYTDLKFKGQPIKIGLSGGILYHNADLMKRIDVQLKKRGMSGYRLAYPQVPPEISALALSYRQTGDAGYMGAVRKVIGQVEDEHWHAMSAVDYTEE